MIASRDGPPIARPAWVNADRRVGALGSLHQIIASRQCAHHDIRLPVGADGVVPEKADESRHRPRLNTLLGGSQDLAAAKPMVKHARPAADGIVDLARMDGRSVIQTASTRRWIRVPRWPTDLDDGLLVASEGVGTPARGLPCRCAHCRRQIGRQMGGQF